MAAKRHHSAKHISRKQSDPMPDSVHGGYVRSSHEMYAGPSMSKRMMSRDGSMIYEDHSAPCLLPTDVIDREFPMARGKGVNGSMVNDLFSETLRQMSEDQEALAREKEFHNY